MWQRRGPSAWTGSASPSTKYRETGFELNIIPHTADVTIIDDYAAGTVVNVEVDLLARYLERLLGKDGDDISLDFLKAHGYA